MFSSAILMVYLGYPVLGDQLDDRIWRIIQFGLHTSLASIRELTCYSPIEASTVKMWERS